MGFGTFLADGIKVASEKLSGARTFREEPVGSGPYRGQRIDHGAWEGILDEYYRFHWWDPVTGLQTREGLSGINLELVADRLGISGAVTEKS